MHATLICGALLAFSKCAMAAELVIAVQGTHDAMPKQPQAAIAADGTVHVIYGVGERVYHVTSIDGGRSFLTPREAFRVTNLSLGRRRGPRLAIAGNTLVISAIGGVQGKGRDGDLQAWRSTDGGETWQGPARVNDVADAAREGLHGMAAAPDGTLWCTWLDLRDKRMQLFASKSTDGGASWQPNLLVYQSPDGNVCECCHPSVIANGDGIHFMFRNSLDGNRDMYVVTSKDGKTFPPAKKLGEGTWRLNACPMDGGMLAAGPAGSLLTVWRREGQVFAASSSDKQETLLGRGEQPWIAGSGGKPFIVWLERRDGALWAKLPGSERPEKLDQAARDPVVVSAEGSGLVIACWESNFNGQPVVYATRLDR
jgi:hypothetical protein